MNKSKKDEKDRMNQKDVFQEQGIIYGRNPVAEALKGDFPIEKVYVQKGATGGTIQHIYRLARARQLPVVQATHAKLNQLADTSKHQGVVAIVSPISFVSLEELLTSFQKQPGAKTLLILDRIQDPHNLGAIIRSAEVLGAQGIILPLRDSAPITETVVKASAGAIFHIPLCKVTNLVQVVRRLKKEGFWIYATSSHAEKNLWEVEFSEQVAIVVGSEGRGVRPLLLKESDEVVRIPQIGVTESLNASVAASLVMYERFRKMKID